MTEERLLKLCLGEAETVLFIFDLFGKLSRLFKQKVEALLRKNGLR